MSSHQDPLANENGRRALLQSIVALTLSVFGAKACSIMRFDEDARELVFEAVAGEGEGALVGRRIPASTGIAGWSLASEEPISIDDVLSHPRFDREVAEQTGYIPTKLTVFPLLHGEESLGVLSVLDAGATAHFGLAGMQSLGHFASHAAMALAAVEAARRGERSRAAAPLASLAAAIDSLDSERRRQTLALIAALEPLIRRQDDA
ncbi:MAG TPA: GAF domain-containing protein [Solirubrobacteraceae bacterium]